MFDVSLDLYKIFCCVVRHGNMSAAARDLYISQPAVSMAIKQLEERLGKPLLLRSSKGIKTTAEGGVLYEYLRQAMGLIETAEKKYTELVNLESGEIKISASDTILSRFLTPYIEKFVRAYPHINFKVANRTSYETIDLLKSGQADVGFVNLPVQEDPQLAITYCMAIHDCVVAGEKYAHLAERGLHVRDLPQYPLLLLDRGSNSRQCLDQYAQTYHVDLSPSIELGAYDLLIKFAVENFGLGFAIQEFTAFDQQTLFQIPLTPPIPERHIGMVQLREVNLSDAAARFTALFPS